jgi:hypothetical protein
MRNDRMTKVLLALIAAGLWSLTMTQLETPEVMAADTAEIPVVSTRADESYSQTSAAIPAATDPLRWRVSLAANQNPDSDNANDCATAISVLSVAPNSTDVTVVFYSNAAGFLASRKETLASKGTLAFSTSGGNGISGTRGVLKPDHRVATGNFTRGFAQVHAGDPRVIVSAFLECHRDRRDSWSQTNAYRGVANIPAYPVGATAQYFIAGMPASWTPPMAAPEVPE